jgi:uncharacterized membrane protein
VTIQPRRVIFFWPAALIVFAIDVAWPSALLRYLMALLLVAPFALDLPAEVMEAARSFQAAVDVSELATAVISGPLIGVVLNLWIGADPGPSFYETCAQIGAALLIAYAVEGRRSLSGRSNARMALALYLGLASGIVVALLASLVAIGRADGSWFLFAMTIGGLATGTMFLLVATLPSAAVAGAFGEDEVVGGGEGGRQGAEEDGVGAEG